MMRRLLAALAVVLMLAGCSGSPAATPSPDQATAAAPRPSEKQLQSARKRAGIPDCPRSGDRAALSDGLPDVTLGCLGSHRTVRLAGLRGRPMVINIWAQWCRPCRIEAPHLATVAEEAGDKVDFIGIDYADPDPAAAIGFAGSARWRYPPGAGPAPAGQGSAQDHRSAADVPGRRARQDRLPPGQAVDQRCPAARVDP
ncbi:redoxin family protein [Microlunatus sp. Gsoil 973]|nr:redoxin family protein [Microlunatus sp. Gsoil 973]